MPEVVFALPVVPGQEQFDRETMDEMEGARRQEYEAAMRAAGITRHAVWHQHTPQGTLAIVYMQANSETSAAQFGASDDPFNRWFRDQMKRAHGVDISQPPPGSPPEKVHDVSI